MFGKNMHHIYVVGDNCEMFLYVLPNWKILLQFYIKVLKMSWGLEKFHHHILGNLPPQSQIPEESIVGVSFALRTEVAKL